MRARAFILAAALLLAAGVVVLPRPTGPRAAAFRAFAQRFAAEVRRAHPASAVEVERVEPWRDGGGVVVLRERTTEADGTRTEREHAVTFAAGGDGRWVPVRLTTAWTVRASLPDGACIPWQVAPDEMAGPARAAQRP